ncbi:MAG: hypothetical protein WC755_09185 [Candidatus Woesearchaeota archaeon]|jgi:hypothetical protein
MAKPVISQAFNALQKPSISVTPEKHKWSFSFEHFNQIQYFGLDRGVNNSWFVSLIERMKELSSIHPEDFFRNRILKDRWRYHEVNWNSTNIPISKSDLKWVDKELLNNDIDFPFYQFHVSKAKGRIVGFWNGGHTIFYIVLLDPLHNIQPAGGKYNYRVDDCYPLGCHLSSLTKDIEDIKAKPCKVDGCDIFKNIMAIPKRQNDTNAVVAYLDDDTLNELNKILGKKTLSDILIEAIINNIGTS